MGEVYLQSFDSAKEYISLSTGIKYLKSKDVKTKGWFKYIDNVLSALFFENNDFFILYNDIKVQINDNIRASILRGNDKYIFQLFDGNNDDLLLQFYYSFDEQLFSLSSVTSSFVEEEDFNWGLFLVNIINDENRRSRIIMNFKY